MLCVFDLKSSFLSHYTQKLMKYTVQVWKILNSIKRFCNNEQMALDLSCSEVSTNQVSTKCSNSRTAPGITWTKIGLSSRLVRTSFTSNRTKSEQGTTESRLSVGKSPEMEEELPVI
jgi:hypothetical protein